MKKLDRIKFKINNHTEGNYIQKLLFNVGCLWGDGLVVLRGISGSYLLVIDGKLYESVIDHYADLKEMTLDELQEIVGNHFYSDVIGCVVDTPMGVDYVKQVLVMSDGFVLLRLSNDAVVLGVNTYGGVDDNVRFFTNDENDDTLPFDEFLEFIRG